MKKASCSLIPVTFVVVLLSLIAIFIVLGTSPVYSQTTQSEQYKGKHDGGDREEYEQEVAYNDPEFYVPPPVNNTASLLV